MIRREDDADLPMLTSTELLAQMDLATATSDRSRIDTLAEMIVDRGRRGCIVAQSWYS